VGPPAGDRHDGLGIRSLLELAQETAHEGAVEERQVGRADERDIDPIGECPQADG